MFQTTNQRTIGFEMLKQQTYRQFMGFTFYIKPAMNSSTLKIAAG